MNVRMNNPECWIFIQTGDITGCWLESSNPLFLLIDVKRSSYDFYYTFSPDFRFNALQIVRKLLAMTNTTTNIYFHKVHDEEKISEIIEDCCCYLLSINCSVSQACIELCIEDENYDWTTIDQNIAIIF